MSFALPPESRRRIVVCLLLATSVAAVYAQVVHHEFIGYDDTSYITMNRHVQGGLTSDSVRWAFTTSHTGYWHPLTWLSLMLDVELFGLWAGGHHLVAVLFHILNALLLYGLLERATGCHWRLFGARSDRRFPARR